MKILKIKYESSCQASAQKISYHRCSKAPRVQILPEMIEKFFLKPILHLIIFLSRLTSQNKLRSTIRARKNANTTDAMD